MSTETFNYISVFLNSAMVFLTAATVGLLCFYTLYTYRLLLATRATATATQSELEVMQKQLDIARLSADSTQKELEILQGQLVTARQAIDIQRENERRAARPLFVWTGSGLNDVTPLPRSHIEFQNHGGPIAVVETVAANCHFTLSPANYIARGGKGAFTIEKFAPSTARFLGIKYVTSIGDIETVVFRIQANPMSPRIDALTKFEGLQRMPSPPQPVDVIPFYT